MFAGREKGSKFSLNQNIIVGVINNTIEAEENDPSRFEEVCIYGCKLGSIAICNHFVCWREHLEAITCRYMDFWWVFERRQTMGYCRLREHDRDHHIFPRH